MRSAHEVLMEWADLTSEDRPRFRVAADQIIAALGAAGYAIVSREPTEAMLAAASPGAERELRNWVDGYNQIVWRAMADAGDAA